MCGTTRSAAHRIGDARLLRTRDEVVDEHAQPSSRPGLELGHDAHQVVHPAEVFHDDTFDPQVLAPHLRDEFGVVATLNIDPAGAR